VGVRNNRKFRGQPSRTCSIGESYARKSCLRTKIRSFCFLRHVRAVENDENVQSALLMPASDLYNVARNHDIYKARKIRLQAQWNLKAQLSLRARLGNALLNPPSTARRSRILTNTKFARRRRLGMKSAVSVYSADTLQLQALNQNHPSMASSSPPRTTSARATCLRHVPLRYSKASGPVKVQKLSTDSKMMEARWW
jgi:hypothetical protein